MCTTILVEALDIGDLYAREPRLALMEFVLEDPRPGTELAVADLRVEAHVLTEEGGVEHRRVDLPVRLQVAEREAAELEDLACRLVEERFVAEDVKYMKQRSYDVGRSKDLASERYRRG